MEFNEKLSFLLNITNTSNIELARSLSVKPSIISLYKTGKREAPKKESTYLRFAEFFSHKINSDYQRNALFEHMNLPKASHPFSTEELSEIILMWLMNKKYISPDPGTTLLRFFETPNASTLSDYSLSESDTYSAVTTGIKDKKKLLRSFLEELLEIDNPKLLYIQGDDSIEWLLYDPVLTSDFINTMKVLATKGCKIVQFLPPSTNSSLIKIYTDWLPLYFGGNVESYYYPRFRDHSFRNSIMCLDDKIAFFSLNIYQGREQGFATLYKNPVIVNSLGCILNDYKALCHKVFTLLTTPQSIADVRIQMGSLPVPRISSRAMLPHELLPKELQRKTQDYFNKMEYKDCIIPPAVCDNFFNQPHIDICRIASKEEILAGKVNILIPDFIGIDGPAYTVKTYSMHLKCILKAMEEHDDYIFVPVEPTENSVTLMIRRGVRAILMHKSIFPNVLLVTEPDLIRTLEEHLDRRADDFIENGNARKNSIRYLKKLIKELDN